MSQSTNSISQRYKQLMEAGDMEVIYNELYDKNVITIQTYAWWNSNNLEDKKNIMKSYFEVSWENMFLLSNPLVLWKYFKVIVTAVWKDAWTHESYQEKFLCVFEVNKWKITNEWYFYENFERFSSK